MIVHLSAETGSVRVVGVMTFLCPPGCGPVPGGTARCDGGDAWDDEGPGEDEDEDDEDEDEVEDEEAGWGDEPPDGPGWSVLPPATERLAGRLTSL